MTKSNKNKRAAKLALELGYTHIATIVKQVFNTTYHNVNSAQSVIESGWSGAPTMYRHNCRRGVIASGIDWSKTISRAQLFIELEKREAN